MILMEDNTKFSFSSHLRTLRHNMNSTKRARSPEDNEESGNRPLKRPSLATDNVAPSGYSYLSHSSANSSRQTSEDWVQQAGVLSIDSPIYTSSEHSHAYTSQDELTDVDMTMEAEEVGDSASETPRKAQHTNIQHTNMSASSYPQSGHSQHMDTPYSYVERQQNAVIPPHINVVPATPVTDTRPHHIANSSSLVYSVSHPPTPPGSPVPMAISPTSSLSQVTSPRVKRRVVFGPRSNCEKCRLGERHNFIHYDHDE